MRTTINLSSDTHQIASTLARAKNISLSQAVDELIRQAQNPPAPATIITEPNGLPVFAARGHRITSEIVREALEEDNHSA